MKEGSRCRLYHLLCVLLYAANKSIGIICNTKLKFFNIIRLLKDFRTMQFSYEVGKRLRTKAINKFGKYIGLTEERMNKASEIFNKHGNIVIVVAYFLPGVRHIMGYFSGITKIDAKRFHIYSTVGGIFWVLTFISLGYLLGPSAERFSDEIHKYGILLFALFAVVFVIYFVIKKMKKKSTQ